MKKKYFHFYPFFLFFFLLYEKMDVGWTYHGSHFTIHVNQTIILHSLNIHGDVCQLFLDATDKKIYYVFETYLKISGNTHLLTHSENNQDTKFYLEHDFSLVSEIVYICIYTWSSVYIFVFRK